MDQPEQRQAAEPIFTQPVRQIVTIFVALGLVVAGVVLALPKVLPVFLANLYLNGFIAFVFVIGLGATFWQIWQIVRSVSWINAFVAGAEGLGQPPRLLAPLATLMRARGAKMQIGSSSARSILDSVATRIDEERDITRYITNLLIFLGLLGTFFGLATTVPAVVDTIRSLAPQDGDGGVEVFNRLMTGLENQLGGMGTAFSSSLLGLAGSLVVGLIELFATHGQNRFYREFEEWLSSITRLGIGPGDDSGEGGATAWLAAMAEQMEAMQTTLTRSDASRSQLEERLGTLAGAVERLTERIAAEGVSTPHIIRMAESQERMLALMEAQAEAQAEAGGAHVDAESRMRLRSIDVQLLRILEEMGAGREEAVNELRAEIAQITRVLRQLGGGRG